MRPAPRKLKLTNRSGLDFVLPAMQLDGADWDTTRVLRHGESLIVPDALVHAIHLAAGSHRPQPADSLIAALRRRTVEVSEVSPGEVQSP